MDKNTWHPVTTSSLQWSVLPQMIVKADCVGTLFYIQWTCGMSEF